MSSLYGLSEYGAEQALASTNVLPGGTNKYIALLTALPTARDGTGLVEATGGSYARIAHSVWVNVTSGNDTIRKNSGTVVFPTLTANLSGVVGCAIYSAVTAGNLIWMGPLQDSTGIQITRNFIIGDIPTLADQELEAVIGAG